MINLKPDNRTFQTHTFINEKVEEAFREKHKNITAKMIARDGSLESNIDLSHRLSVLVKDWGSKVRFELHVIHSNVSNDVFYYAQVGGLCGAVTIYMSSWEATDNVFEWLEDFLYLLGYSVIFISLRSTRDFIRVRGYNSYMTLNNRRTSNDITLYYKQLNFTL